MTVGEAYTQLLAVLKKIYEPREAANIANLVVAHVTGFSNTERMVRKNDVLTTNRAENLNRMAAELALQKPVQYVLGEAYFYGMKLYVDEHVLIPRPETEELVEWVIEDVKNQDIKNRIHDASFKNQAAGNRDQNLIIVEKFKTLDVGTGSGCIAIAVKKSLPQIAMYATDISEKALQTARKNAAEQKTEIQFSAMNILDEHQWNGFPMFDCIISNPPYIAPDEAAFMNNNVLNFEPHLALFAPAENPLQFYDAIGFFGLQHLKKEGELFFEINEVFADEVAVLLSKKTYQNIEIRKDSQGKNRMIKAKR